MLRRLLKRHGLEVARQGLLIPSLRQGGRSSSGRRNAPLAGPLARRTGDVGLGRLQLLERRLLGHGGASSLRSRPHEDGTGPRVPVRVAARGKGATRSGGATTACGSTLGGVVLGFFVPPLTATLTTKLLLLLWRLKGTLLWLFGLWFGATRAATTAARAAIGDSSESGCWRGFGHGDLFKAQVIPDLQERRQGVVLLMWRPRAWKHSFNPRTMLRTSVSSETGWPRSRRSSAMHLKRR